MQFDEAARYLGLDVTTLTRLLKVAGVPVTGKGRKRRVSFVDLEGFVDSCRVRPGTILNDHPAARTRQAG